MVIRLIREPGGNDNTFGVMFLDGFYQAFTLENSRKIIPAGEYNIKFYNSPKNKRIVPLLQDVTNRTMIEIHPANFFHELEGCIAVGNGKTQHQLLESIGAFEKLINKILGKDIKIKIEDWA